MDRFHEYLFARAVNDPLSLILVSDYFALREPADIRAYTSAHWALTAARVMDSHVRNALQTVIRRAASRKDFLIVKNAAWQLVDYAPSPLSADPAIEPDIVELILGMPVASSLKKRLVRATLVNPTG